MNILVEPGLHLFNSAVHKLAKFQTEFVKAWQKSFELHLSIVQFYHLKLAEVISN